MHDMMSYCVNVCSNYALYIHNYCSICSTTPFIGYAVAQWLGIRLQMLGVAMVTGVSFIAVLEHHFNTVDPGEV